MCKEVDSPSEELSTKNQTYNSPPPQKPSPQKLPPPSKKPEKKDKKSIMLEQPPIVSPFYFASPPDDPDIPNQEPNLEDESASCSSNISTVTDQSETSQEPVILPD